jgi:hypothetical protein
LVRELSPRVNACAPPRFAQVAVSSPSNDPCRDLPSYVRIGAEARSFYRKVGGACQPVAAPAGSADFFEVEPFALEGFARGSLREGATAEGIRPVYIRGEDGSEAFLTFRDAEESFDCGVGRTDDGLRCVPQGAPMAMGTHFSDASCQEPAAVAVGCLVADSAPYVIDAPMGNGGEELRMRRGGARLAASYAGSSEPGACVQQQELFQAFPVGEAVPSSRFVAGAIEDGADAAGLVAPVHQAGGWSAAGIAMLRSENFEGYSCELLPTSDGVVRCVPRPSFYPIEFADAACTEPLIEGWETTTAVAIAEQCPVQVSVFELGEEYAGPVYKKADDTLCLYDHEQSAGPSRSRHRRLGSQVPNDDLPAVAIRLR